ncbi:cytochrome P450 [Wenjunlia tyrosinilytica]|nr:cytochrome P450 [Wenjunlia tyrosinilytica]
MTTETTTALPPVHFWAVEDLRGLDFDPLLDRLLREEPVSRIQLPNGEGYAWLVTRYDDVKFVTSDPRFSRKAVIGRPITRLAPHFVPMADAVGFADPPEHTRLRKVVARAFTAKAMARLRSSAQEFIDGLLDEMERQGPPADLMQSLNIPFPVAMMCELMGVPSCDRDQVAEWSRTLISAAHGREASERANAELGTYFSTLLDIRAEDPREDVAGVLRAAVDRDELTLAEAVGLAVLLQVGGSHAVPNNSANMVYALLTHPRHLDRLRTEPELVPQAVDELLRYIPHRNAVGLSRIAMEEVEVGGVRIPEGDAVYVSYLAANRDPEVFPDPHTLDFDRSYNPHVSFGHGPHYCPGAMLARMESEVVVSTLWERLPGLRLAVPEEEIRWQRGALIRGPVSLPVTW